MRIWLYIFMIVGFSLVGASASAQPRADWPDYGLWEKVLNQYVDENGMVDYAALKRRRKWDFDPFIFQLTRVSLDNLAPEEEKAFWINAYNAITIKTLLGSYPVDSMIHIADGMAAGVRQDVALTRKSLSDIEHRILRPLGDPRIHFALNRASKGSPKLSRQPYIAATLDDQLDAAARRFINDPDHVRIDPEAVVLYHSEIFTWYKEDFEAAAGSIPAYIARYRDDASDAAVLEDEDLLLEELDYEWGLNEQ